MAGPIFLETDRLTLRRIDQADVDDVFELDADQEVMRFLTGGKPTPRSVIENEILPRILREYKRFPELGRWAATDRTTGTFMGWFELRPPEHGAGVEVELGYRLRRAAWGRGLATEGSRALIRKAFTELGVRRVYAETMAVNRASRRVMEKAGLKYVRTSHPHFDDPIEGTEYGEVEYDVHKDAWIIESGSPGAAALS